MIEESGETGKRPKLQTPEALAQEMLDQWTQAVEEWTATNPDQPFEPLVYLIPKPEYLRSVKGHLNRLRRKAKDEIEAQKEALRKAMKGDPDSMALYSEQMNILSYPYENLEIGVRMGNGAAPRNGHPEDRDQVRYILLGQKAKAISVKELSGTEKAELLKKMKGM